MMDSEHRWTPLLDSPTALLERRGRTLVWEARTDFGIVGVYPRAILTKSDKLIQKSLPSAYDSRGPSTTSRRQGNSALEGYMF